MSTYAISDIHGNLALFKEALKQIDLSKKDKLFILGDCIDRGADSKGVLDTVMQLLEEGFHVECLLGNHEQMLLDASLGTSNLNLWLVNGGQTTLASFGVSAIHKIPAKYYQFIQSFKYYIADEYFVYAHAAINMHLDDPLLDIDTILWERNPAQYVNMNWLGKRKLVHGHTPTSQTSILQTIQNDEKIICIDNGTFLNRKNFGSLCVLHAETFGVQFCNIGY